MVNTSARPTRACTRGKPPNWAISAAITPTEAAAPTIVVSSEVHPVVSFGLPFGIVTVPSCSP
jgi:hypothetical protein